MRWLDKFHKRYELCPRSRAWLQQYSTPEEALYHCADPEWLARILMQHAGINLLPMAMINLILEAEVKDGRKVRDKISHQLLQALIFPRETRADMRSAVYEAYISSNDYDCVMNYVVQQHCNYLTSWYHNLNQTFDKLHALHGVDWAYLLNGMKKFPQWEQIIKELE